MMIVVQGYSPVSLQQRYSIKETDYMDLYELGDV